MSNHDDVERLFALKSKGAITEEEFSRAKAQILGADRKPHARVPLPSPSSPSLNAGAETRRHGRFHESYAIKMTVALIMAGFAAGALWYVFGHDEASLQTVPDEGPDVLAKSKPTDEGGSPRQQEKIWTIKEGAAIYGFPETDDTETLECEPTNAGIKYTLFWPDEAIGRFVRIDARGSHSTKVALRFNEDANEMPSATGFLEKDDPVLNDLFALRRGLRLHWEDGTDETLPIPPDVLGFIGSCRDTSLR